MKPELLKLLRCPLSGQPLALDPQRTTYRHGMLWNGRLTSPAQTWFIRDGIVDLLAPAASYTGAQLVNRLPLAAWGYERLWRPHALSLLSGSPLPLNEELALMEQQLAPRRGGVFLDLACSTGLYGRALARDIKPGTGMVICLDHSTAMLQEAARNARSAGVQVALVRANAENLPFADGVFAGVACGGSFNEFDNGDRVISEVRRILQADGRSWWMQAQAAPTLAGRLLQRGLSSGGIRFPSGDALARALRSAGLRVTFDERRGAVQLIATRGHVLATHEEP